MTLSALLAGAPLRQGGVVTSYDHRLGIGVIAPDDGSPEVPVYIGAIERSGLPALMAGQDVAFTVAAGVGNEPYRAVDIVIL